MAKDWWGDEAAEETSGSYDSGSSAFSVIPKGTKVLFAMDEIKLDEDRYGNEYISTRWVVMGPGEYKNRKVFHKIKIWDADTTKKGKAEKLIKAIDANSGGKLRASGKTPDDWDDDLLSECLLNKPMLGTLGVWELDDKSASGNWIMAVDPKEKADDAKPAEPVKPKQKPIIIDEDDNIPF